MYCSPELRLECSISTYVRYIPMLPVAYPTTCRAAEYMPTRARPVRLSWDPTDSVQVIPVETALCLSWGLGTIIHGSETVVCPTSYQSKGTVHNKSYHVKLITATLRGKRRRACRPSLSLCRARLRLLFDFLAYCRCRAVVAGPYHRHTARLGQPLHSLPCEPLGFCCSYTLLSSGVSRLATAPAWSLLHTRRLPRL